MSTSTKKLATAANLLAALRRDRNLTQDEAATLLGVSRNYISMIENGRPPGRKFLARLTEELAGNEHSQVSARKGTPDVLRTEIERHLRQVLTLAADDIGKLGWLLEQMRRHVSPHEHWDSPAKVIARLRAEEDRKDKEALAGQSATDHGKAI